MKKLWQLEKFWSFTLAVFLLCSLQYFSLKLGWIAVVAIANAASPSLDFISPTPNDGSGQASSSIPVKLQSSDENGAHYTFVDFDYDLKLWLRMDNISGDNPVDSSSYSSITLKQGDAVQTNSGKFGKGFNFDGNGDYLLIARPVENDFTICAWIKTTKAGVGIPHYLTAPVLESEIGGVGYDFGFGIDSNGKMAFGIGGMSDITIHGSTTVTNNQWHHVCSTRNNSTGALVLYTNGNQEATAAASLGSLSANAQARIGDGTDGATGFQGTIDDLVVFKRVLSSTEILSLYDAVNNQYDHTFASLSNSTHSFTGYSVDALGNMAQTIARSVTTGVLDLTPPSAPVSFSANTNGLNVSLAWINPIDNDFNSVTIRRSTSGFPATPSSDTAVSFNNIGTSYDDNNLVAGTYYYSIFARDLTGNFSVAATASVTIDITAPTVSFASASVASGGRTNLSSIPFTVTFSENVSGFTADDITITNGTLNNLVLVAANTMWSFNVVPTSKSVTLNMGAGEVEDAAGNANTAATAYTFTLSSGGWGALGVEIGEYIYTSNPLEVFSPSNSIASGEASSNSESNLSSSSTSNFTSDNVNLNKATPLETIISGNGNDPDPIVSIVNNEPFMDISGHWAYDYIIQLYQLQVIQGRIPKKFVPEGNLTRAEAVKIGLLTYGYKLDADDFRSGFTDLEVNAWYISYIRKAKKEGFISGAKFRPNEDITREDALVLLLKMAKKEGMSKATPFSDISQKSVSAPSINYAYDQGVIQGRNADKFEPLATITRAEIAKIAMKIKSL